MQIRNGITLTYRNECKSNYRNLNELVNDLNTDTLVKIAPKERHAKYQDIIINEITKRHDLTMFGLKRLLNQCK